MCTYPGCRELALAGHRRCEKHYSGGSASGDAEVKRRIYDEGRQNSDLRKLYKTAGWFRMRKAILDENPLCVECLKHRRITVATDVDHIKPHRGDPEVFFDSSNLQPLCKSCHSAKTLRGE
jgi:5-methylcytosine-specific restriction protein A